ncbi:DUF7210 family protein [Vacuolonema iberomarrocanum]|uniref:DUF7210 family protein n=1 Tax=Vacuolonema iberomarrocanum TaxID=3454632 RepID=UPI001A06CA16|nr:hypothetical protein [filamentous cyanobacterium LEGE 07170]
MRAQVTKKGPLRHDGTTYTIGDELELPTEVAKTLADNGIVTILPATAKTSKTPAKEKPSDQK